MPVIAGLIIEGIGTLGMPILRRLMDDDKDAWLDLLEGAISGIPGAITAVQNLLNMQENGHIPTADELRAELAASRGIHNRIQNG